MNDNSSYNYAGEELSVHTTFPIYTRIIQIDKTKAHLIPLYVQRFAKDLPPGVNLSIKEYTEEEHQARFKENPELIEIREEIEKLQAQTN